MSATNIVVVVPLLSILALATVSDLLERRIPNGLSLGGAAVGLLINAGALGPQALGLGLLGWIVCLGLFLPLYVGRGMAAGDVKLMAMVGAFLGPAQGFLACVCTLIAGATLAALCLTWRHIAARLGADAQWVGVSADRPGNPGEHLLDKIPYAAAIALGATVAVVQPLWLTALLPLGVLP